MQQGGVKAEPRIKARLRVAAPMVSTELPNLIAADGDA
jgi:hypothetical protein